MMSVTRIKARKPTKKYERKYGGTIDVLRLYPIMKTHEKGSQKRRDINFAYALRRDPRRSLASRLLSI
jgi:hypothetical protein